MHIVSDTSIIHRRRECLPRDRHSPTCTWRFSTIWGDEYYEFYLHYPLGDLGHRMLPLGSSTCSLAKWCPWGLSGPHRPRQAQGHTLGSGKENNTVFVNKPGLCLRHSEQCWAFHMKADFANCIRMATGEPRCWGKKSLNIETRTWAPVQLLRLWEI